MLDQAAQESLAIIRRLRRPFTTHDRCLVVGSAPGCDCMPPCQECHEVIAVNRAIVALSARNIQADWWVWRDPDAWHWYGHHGWAGICIQSHNLPLIPESRFPFPVYTMDHWRALVGGTMTMPYALILAWVLGYDVAHCYGVAWEGTADWDGYSTDHGRSNDRWTRERAACDRVCQALGLVYHRWVLS